MFRAGFLGLEVWNVFGYILATPDLALKQAKSTATCIEHLFLPIFGCLGCFWLGGCMYVTDKVRKKWNIGYFFITARFVESVVILLTVLIISVADVYCPHCISFDERKHLLFGSNLGFFIVAIVATFLTPLIFYKLYKLGVCVSISYFFVYFCVFFYMYAFLLLVSFWFVFLFVVLLVFGASLACLNIYKYVI